MTTSFYERLARCQSMYDDLEIVRERFVFENIRSFTNDFLKILILHQCSLFIHLKELVVVRERFTFCRFNRSQTIHFELIQLFLNDSFRI